jgi:preprotein translocase subunit SecA
MIASHAAADSGKAGTSDGGGGSSAYGDAADGSKQRPQKQETVRRDKPKIGRNDPCHCGSGKKYKKCHGRSGSEAQA